MKLRRRNRHSKMIVRESLALGTMTLPAILLFAVFHYLPMFGVVLAFKNYKVPKGILGSDWVNPWYKNFEFFLKSNDAWRITRNTLLLNFMFIFAGIFCSVCFALLMYEVKKRRHVKLYQTVSILPSFLSMVAVSYIVYAVLDPSKGVLNRIIEAFGGEGISWYTEPSYWPVILLIVRLWSGLGYGSLMYYASLMGIDDTLFEAAELDGANKWQRTKYICLPHLKSLIIIYFILDMGKIFRADFGLFYNVTRNVGNLYPTTDVIDTYIFRALMENGNFTLSSAASLLQSVVGTVLLLLTNFIVKKIDPDKALF